MSRTGELHSVKGCQEEVGSRMGDGYRDVNAAVDWIVISSHWFRLVQLPGRSIIPPGVGWDLIRPGVWLPPPTPLTYSSFILSLPQSLGSADAPSPPWAPAHHRPPLRAPVSPPPLQDLPAIAVSVEESACRQWSVKATDDLLPPAVSIPDEMARW